MMLSVPLKVNLADKANYGNRRGLDKIEYIVIHYTANDGDTDESNGKYFKNNVVKSSAHYFVDDDSVTRSVPDDYTAYHCGASRYKHKVCRNANSLGIELCDDVRNGVVYPSAKTIENALELVKELMKKYGIPKENVIRHFDVTGKRCPLYWVDDKLWKGEFWDKLSGDKSFLVKVKVSKLGIRAGSGKEFAQVGVIEDRGVYTIVEVSGVWGRLKSGEGWINLDYTKRV